MYIARVPNRKSHPTILLRESWREGARIKNRTLANLTQWPAEKIAALDQVLKRRHHRLLKSLQRLGAQPTARLRDA